MAVDTPAKPSITLEEAIIQMSASLATSMAEMSKKMAETEAELSRKLADSNAIIAETSKRREEDREALDKWVGYFGNSIGNIVEMVLIPGIKKKINDFGHSFNSLSPRKQFYHANGKTYAEVDLFLENGEEVMVVEVKTQLSVKEVERQLKRLELLRKNEAGSLKGKIIYSAVAGLQIEEDAQEMALGLGMYVVEMVEDTKSVNVIKPSGKLGTW
ncbi:MAG: hypothetical protein LBC59_05095 [Chitinispirillales bacterium]|jgi:hypothetical protein|nr:hypothetical protein [Chitinispirillales bacterium]